jgi:hypothetical protein
MSKAGQLFAGVVPHTSHRIGSIAGNRQSRGTGSDGELQKSPPVH